MCKDLDVKAIMDTWIKQKGYPVVYIEESNAQSRDGSIKMIASQKRFLRDIKQGTQKYHDEAKGWVTRFMLRFILISCLALKLNNCHCITWWSFVFDEEIV